jgi:hypothetical protein
MNAFHQPPPIPNRNSGFFTTTPSPTRQQTPFIIAPSPVASPQAVHSYKQQPNSMHYASTIRPVSLEPVPEHDDDLMNEPKVKFAIEPTIEDLDAVFGAARHSATAIALAPTGRRSIVQNNSNSGPPDPRTQQGRVSPSKIYGTRQQDRTSSQKLHGSGRVSPLNLAPMNTQRQQQYQPTVLQQHPWPPPIQPYPQSPPSSKRLSGIGVSRLSTASTAAASEGKRGSMMVGGSAQTGWHRQPGVGVGFLPA